MTSPRDLAVKLLGKPTDRDKQRKIGASNASNPCTRCLADDLRSVPQERGQYFLGAVIGTAVHALLEERAAQDDNLLTEQRVTIGEIPGYGVITSTMDLYDKEQNLVIDWKTTTKDKLVFLKRAHTTEFNEYEVTKITQARYNVLRYTSQTKLYGLGMHNAGYDVAGVAPVYIARDGLTEGPDCIWAPPVLEFNVDEARTIFDRSVRLWEWLEEGNDPDLLPQHEHCYTCNVQRR